MNNLGLKVLSLFLAFGVWLAVSAPRRERVIERAFAAPLSLGMIEEPEPRVALHQLRNALTHEVGDAFASRTGFDPRQLAEPYLYFRVHPQRLLAWREANELKGRELMRDGEWVG